MGWVMSETQQLPSLLVSVFSGGLYYSKSFFYSIIFYSFLEFSTEFLQLSGEPYYIKAKS